MKEEKKKRNYDNLFLFFALISLPLSILLAGGVFALMSLLYCVLRWQKTKESRNIIIFNLLFYKKIQKNLKFKFS